MPFGATSPKGGAVAGAAAAPGTATYSDDLNPQALGAIAVTTPRHDRLHCRQGSDSTMRLTEYDSDGSDGSDWSDASEHVRSALLLTVWRR